MRVLCYRGLTNEEEQEPVERPHRGRPTYHGYKTHADWRERVGGLHEFVPLAYKHTDETEYGAYML